MDLYYKTEINKEKKGKEEIATETTKKVTIPNLLVIISLLLNSVVFVLLICDLLDIVQVLK